MIKVFTTGESPDKAGDILTEQFQKWEKELSYNVKVKRIHSNSNKWGWMLVVSYEEETNTDRWK